MKGNAGQVRALCTEIEPNGASAGPHVGIRPLGLPPPTCPEPQDWALGPNTTSPHTPTWQDWSHHHLGMSELGPGPSHHSCPALGTEIRCLKHHAGPGAPDWSRNCAVGDWCHCFPTAKFLGLWARLHSTGPGLSTPVLHEWIRAPFLALRAFNFPGESLL